MSLITCPNCKHEFVAEEAISKSLEKDYEQKFNAEKQKLLRLFSDQQKNAGRREKRI